MLEPRFLKNVSVKGPNDCWEWKPYKGRYPSYYCSKIKRNINAHRYVCELYHGDMTNKVARHTCDNTKCVNPKHIVPGSQRDNVMDAIERGRHYQL